MPFFNSLVQRIGYGAIMYNGNSTSITSCYPFFTSQSLLGSLTSLSSSGLGTISITDIDNYWTVMPGYKLEVYADNNYGGAVVTYDNTTGVVPVNYTRASPDIASSIKLYFNNTLIEQTDKATTISVPLFNGSTVTASNYATTYDIAYGSTYYHVYEFYTGSTGTLSFTGGSTVSNIQGLLIGGGGGGGNYFNGNTGSAGGGAGSVVTTSFTAAPGDTFTITVGAGGAGGGANSNNPGLVGSVSSITRTVGGVATLNAGGGGGGGSVNQPAGNNQSFGSTGGGTGANSAATITAHTVTGSVFTNIISSSFRGGSGVGNGYGGGGGGGAGAVGGNGAYLSSAGAGGAGRAWTVTGGRLFAGGGGGMNSTSGGNAGGGGSGGGGAGYSSATANTGSGGGAGFAGTAGGSGGSGICIIAVPV
jgi:fibronectin-binding autotransporter adhesin